MSDTTREGCKQAWDAYREKQASIAEDQAWWDDLRPALAALRGRGIRIVDATRSRTTAICARWVKDNSGGSRLATSSTSARAPAMRTPRRMRTFKSSCPPAALQHIHRVVRVTPEPRGVVPL